MAENDDKEKKIITEMVNKEAWWRPAISMFLKLSAWIAIPIIIALYLGQWLDEKYKTEPWLFLISIGLAFTVSIIAIIKETVKEIKRMDMSNGKKFENFKK